MKIKRTRRDNISAKSYRCQKNESILIDGNGVIWILWREP